MPYDFKKYILENVNTNSHINKEPYKKPTSVDVGDRDNQLFSYINNIYYKTRLDYDEVLCLAKHFNETVFEEPLPIKTVEFSAKKNAAPQATQAVKRTAAENAPKRTIAVEPISLSPSQSSTA